MNGREGRRNLGTEVGAALRIDCERRVERDLVDGFF